MKSASAAEHWCDVAADVDGQPGLDLWLATADGRKVRFTFEDPLRDDAQAVIADLERRGLQTAMLSGDRAADRRGRRQEAAISTWQAACKPADKVRQLEALAQDGRHVLMVGDGLNDAAALAAAHVSLSPASAVDISQAAADAIFQGRLLGPTSATS